MKIISTVDSDRDEVEITIKNHFEGEDQEVTTTVTKDEYIKLVNGDK